MTNRLGWRAAVVCVVVAVLWIASAEQAQAQQRGGFKIRTAIYQKSEGKSPFFQVGHPHGAYYAPPATWTYTYYQPYYYGPYVMDAHYGLPHAAYWGSPYYNYSGYPYWAYAGGGGGYYYGALGYYRPYWGYWPYYGAPAYAYYYW